MTLRARIGLPSLRRDDVFTTMRAAFTRASNRRFRLLHFSVRADHLHLLVEGDGVAALRRGIQGLAIRVAKAINRVLRRRGSVWDHRYHARDLPTPREVRHALVYVLQKLAQARIASPGLGSSFVGLLVLGLANSDQSALRSIARGRAGDVGWRASGGGGMA